MRYSTLFATALAAVFAAGSASAQTLERFSLEGRLGITFPSGDLSDAGYGSGFALGLDGIYNFTPALSAYAGLSRHNFSCDEDEACEDGAVAGGFQGGLKLLLRREGNVLPWARGGLIGQTLDPNGETSDLGLGFEVGAGADIGITPRFSVVPALQYRSFSADFGESDVTAGWFALTLGGHLHF